MSLTLPGKFFFFLIDWFINMFVFGCGVCVAVRGLPLVGQVGATPGCGVRASPCSGCSGVGAWAVGAWAAGAWASVFAAHGLSSCRLHGRGSFGTLA